MKYLKKFETQSAYTAAESSLILPNVSLIAETNGVAYKPVEPVPSHDFVEIGGIKWATMNVGATGVTDTGLYFQWGDTQGYTAAQVGSGEGKKYFDWTDYKYNPSGDGETFTKYNETDELITLESSDDAVTAAWGGSWRMPTQDEFAALVTATTSAWTANYEGSSIPGLVLTSKADSNKKLFFPASGFSYEGTVKGDRINCYYWSSSLSTSSVSYAYYLWSLNGIIDWGYNNNRYGGYTVRGVLG